MPADSSVTPSHVVDAADDILDKSANLIAAARTAADDPDNANSRAQLTQVSTENLFLLRSIIPCRVVQ